MGEKRENKIEINVVFSRLMMMMMMMMMNAIH
jgi:hypothetical protein